MRRRSRTRRVLKWVGLALCVVLASTYALSGYRLEWTQLDGGRTIRVMAGYVQYGWASGGIRYGRLLYRDGQRFRASRLPGWPVLWWPPIDVFGSGGKVRVMLWVPLLVIAAPTALLWYRDRRIPAGHCQNCGYDLTGNVSGICSECGTAIHEKAAR